jgi:hypothetical protein
MKDQRRNLNPHKEAEKRLCKRFIDLVEKANWRDGNE